METVNISALNLSAAQLKELAKKQAQIEFEAEQAKLQEYQTREHHMVEAIYLGLMKYNSELELFKDMSIKEVLDHSAYANQNWGKNKGKGKQTSNSWQNKDKTLKVELVFSPKWTFDSRAKVFVENIKEILKARFEGVADGLYQFVDDVLTKNKNGDYDITTLNKARKTAQERNDKELVDEFNKLMDCKVESGISRYLRVYKKDKKGTYKRVSSNFSEM